jgi:ribulose-5-phosphate 4-epimerase/fuculose-1-phosphate aldolase
VLAREIRERTQHTIRQSGRVPRLILLQNHGMIALGATPESTLACLLMANKAAAIFQGSASLGGPIFLSTSNVDRIAGRMDEAYRQRQVKL